MSREIDQAETLRSLVGERLGREGHGAPAPSSDESAAEPRASTQEDELRDWITVNGFDNAGNSIPPYPQANPEGTENLASTVTGGDSLVHWSLGANSTEPGSASLDRGSGGR